MEKKNIGMKISIVILCLLVVGLIGYIVYDKVLSKNNEKCVDNNILNDITQDNQENNSNTDLKTEEESYELEKLIRGYWWIEGTDKLLNFYNSHFSIGRDGKGCGPEQGCGAGIINSIEQKEYNKYDINFAYYGNDGSNIYLATIDISNIVNNKITLVNFYKIEENEKTSLIENQEEYVFAGYTRNEYTKYAYAN